MSEVPDFAKEARDLIRLTRDISPANRDVEKILRRHRTEGHAAGLAEGLATAAEIARRFEYTKPRSRLPQDIAEAILSASRELKARARPAARAPSA